MKPIVKCISVIIHYFTLQNVIRNIHDHMEIQSDGTAIQQHLGNRAKWQSVEHTLVLGHLSAVQEIKLLS
jgi:hypothetical protein